MSDLLLMTRICPGCELPFGRRQFPSQLEPVARFRQRKYCSIHCKARSQERQWTDPDGPPWTETASGCWQWDRKLNADGYASIGHSQRAHAWLYKIMVGPVPAGLELDHTCRNRGCVNPAHLEPVTHAENNRRGASTKLTVEQVRDIRLSGASNADLGRLFNVTPGTISKIRLGRSWVAPSESIEADRLADALREVAQAARHNG